MLGTYCDCQGSISFILLRWGGGEVLEEACHVEKTIYFRGRITLIWSTLSSMPIYFMSLLCMPRVVRLRLEKLKRDFLWGGGGGGMENKPHLVKWEIVCSNKRKGLSKLNRALLGKWSWRFVEERGTLWKQVISRKYGIEEGGWCTREVMEGYGVGYWKEIRKEWSLMKNNFVFSMGDGGRVRFWEERWCGDNALSLSFP